MDLVCLAVPGKTERADFPLPKLLKQAPRVAPLRLILLSTAYAKRNTVWSVAFPAEGPTDPVTITGTCILCRRSGDNANITNAFASKMVVLPREKSRRSRRGRTTAPHETGGPSIDEVAATLAHEVNQPLSAISIRAATCLRWLLRPQPNLEELRKLAQAIVDDAHRAALIVANIRTMTTRSAPKLAPISVNEIIGRCARILQHELDTEQIRCEMDLDLAMPKLGGDEVQIQQVVINLCMNAIQAMAEAGSPVRVLTFRSWNVGDGTVRVSVEDTGPGIAEELRNRVFDNFFSTKPSGMGLGLSICQSIIASHGGTIEATSPAGACFSFALPIAAR